MNKKLKIIISAVSIIFMISSVFYLQFSSDIKSANALPLLPDKTIIKSKVHLNRILDFNSLSDIQERSNKINNYLSGLTAKGLLEAAAELGNYYTEIKQEPPKFEMFAPYVIKHWKNGVPFAEVSQIVKDKEYNHYFRMMIIDLAGSINEKQGRSNKDLIDSILSISEDKTENTKLRRYAILELEVPGANKYSSEAQSTSDTVLSKIFSDESAPPEVRGASITAMQRTSDPNFNNSVISVISYPEKYDGIMIRHSVIDTALSGLSKEYMDKLKNIVHNTNDSETYGTTIFALGIDGGVEAIKTIINEYGKYDNHICNFSLERNEKTIISMLSEGQSIDTIEAGIKAAEILKFESFLGPLEEIRSKTQDNTLKKIASEAISIVKSNPRKNNPKWEVN